MTVMETVLTVAVVILCGCLILTNYRVNQLEQRFNEWSKELDHRIAEAMIMISNIKDFYGN